MCRFAFVVHSKPLFSWGAGLKPPRPPIKQTLASIPRHIRYRYRSPKGFAGSLRLEAARYYSDSLSEAGTRQGCETLESIHEGIRECFQNFLDPSGNPDKFHFWSFKGVAEGGKAQEQERKKSSPSSIHCSTKRIERGIASGGWGLGAGQKGSSSSGSRATNSPWGCMSYQEEGLSRL